MNKRNLIVAMCAATFGVIGIGCNDKAALRQFEVDGTVKNSGAGKIYLEENVAGGQPTIMDSANLNGDGRFTLKAPVKEESLYQLRLGGKKTPFALLINDAPKVDVSADVANPAQAYTVKGSPATQALSNFDKTIYANGMRLYIAGTRVDSLRKAAAADSTVNTAYGDVERVAGEMKTFVRDFLAKSTSPVLTLYALSSYQNTAANLSVPGFNPVETSEIIEAALGRFPQHTALQNVKKSLPSSKAGDFTQPGIDGKPIALSSFRGKWVLLDFWASWCRPCRLDNPNVVKAYNEFKDKNFTVFGVSLDQSRDAWLKAIEQDGLTWTHASDLQFWNNAAATQYGVQGIPANFLIDPQGNIVAQNLHGEEIANTLRRYIK